MGLQVDWFNSIIQVTSPTISVDAQTLHDFIEDQMATPRGMSYEDIIKPEGKIEDPSNPGVFSQIILVVNSPWQVQFWQGSGYTTIFGGKLVGGLSDQPVKATGAANDITVLNSPVDGVTVVTGSALTAAQDAKLTAIEDLLQNIEGTLDHREAMRLILSVLQGDATGLENGNPDFKDLTGGKTRVAGSYISGTRTISTRDTTD